MLTVERYWDAKIPLPLKRRTGSVFGRGLSLLQSLLCCLAGRPRLAEFQQAIGELFLIK